MSFLRYLHPRPPMNLTASQRETLDRLLTESRAYGSFSSLDLGTVPVWQALCYFADEHGLKLHGTGDSAIREFVPRKPQDANPFGAQSAVYAASDGIWPMFYAILDRDPPFSLHNACFRILSEGDEPGDPLYFFSIERNALGRRPFRPGYVYLLPGETFERDPQSELQGVRLRVEHWASTSAVRPLAIVRVEPEDFPFLAQIRGHRDEHLFPSIEADPFGFPWVEEEPEP